MIMVIHANPIIVVGDEFLTSSVVVVIVIIVVLLVVGIIGVDISGSTFVVVVV